MSDFSSQTNHANQGDVPVMIYGQQSREQSKHLEHNYPTLIELFDNLFSVSENTRLVCGDEEPVYLPANDQCEFHQVVFAYGYFSSALHEIAHWCLAGKQRRLQLDYGYWYQPDGRSAQQQAEFEKVEIKPQALEWIFSKACNKSFRVSIDNLNGEDSDPNPFRRAVHQQVQTYCNAGLPVRAFLFQQALAHYFSTPLSLTANDFLLDEVH